MKVGLDSVDSKMIVLPLENLVSRLLAQMLVLQWVWHETTSQHVNFQNLKWSRWKSWPHYTASPSSLLLTDHCHTHHFLREVSTPAALTSYAHFEPQQLGGFPGNYAWYVWHAKSYYIILPYPWIHSLIHCMWDEGANVLTHDMGLKGESLTCDAMWEGWHVCTMVPATMPTGKRS